MASDSNPSAGEAELARTVRILEAKKTNCEMQIAQAKARIEVIDTQLAALQPK